MRYLLATALLSVSVSGVGYTFKDSGPANVPITSGGVITPGTFYPLNIKDPLKVGRLYNLKCNIQNPNYSNPYPVVLYIPQTGVNSNTLNGHPFVNSMAVLDQYNNLLVIPKITWGYTNNLYNYDNASVITITECKAYYATEASMNKAYDKYLSTFSQ